MVRAILFVLTLSASENCKLNGIRSENCKLNGIRDVSSVDTRE
jgi:hypothetical protein